MSGPPDLRTMHIRTNAALRHRLRMCAELVGASDAEFVRGAIRAARETVESGEEFRRRLRDEPEALT